MYERLKLMRDLLAEDGSIWVHVGPNISHYVKLLMDSVLSPANYRNDIIWQRFNFHADAKRFGIVQDNILFFIRSRIAQSGILNMLN